MFKKKQEQGLIPPPQQQPQNNNNNKKEENRLIQKRNTIKSDQIQELDVVGLIRVVDTPEDLQFYGK